MRLSPAFGVAFFFGLACGGAPVTPVAPIVAPAVSEPAVVTDPPAKVGVSKPLFWDGKRPLVCTGSDSMIIEDVVADLPGKRAIEANGDCTIILKNCTVRGATALYVTGGAKAFVTGGTLSGSDYALFATGEGHAELHEVTLDGAFDTSGYGTISSR